MNGSATSTPPDSVPTPDPVARAMMFAAIALVVVILGLVVAYALSLRSIDAPRTVVERDLEFARAAVHEDPQTQANHLALARAYAQVGRTDEALETIERAYELGETAEAVFTHADILRVGERYKEALRVYDDAEVLAVDAYERTLAELREQRVIEEPPNTLLARVLYGRGLCYARLGDKQQALEDLLGALEITPTDAALLVDVGDAHAALGNEIPAQTAYRQALVFVPGYPRALEGLAALGVEAGE